MGVGKMGVGEMGVGEMGVGKMGVGKMGVGEMGPNRPCDFEGVISTLPLINTCLNQR